MISMLMVRLTQTVHLSCVKISTICPKGQNDLPLEPGYLVVPSSASKTICKPMVHLAQTMHLSWTDTNTVSKQKRSEIPHDPRHLGVPSGASKMIFEPMVCLTQTMPTTLTLFPNGQKWDSTWPTSPRSSIGCVQNDFRAYGMLDANRAPILLLD